MTLETIRQLMSGIIEKDEPQDEFKWEEFEAVCIYQEYFPEYNIDKVFIVYN